MSKGFNVNSNNLHNFSTVTLEKTTGKIKKNSKLKVEIRLNSLFKIHPTREGRTSISNTYRVYRHKKNIIIKNQ